MSGWANLGAYRVRPVRGFGWVCLAGLLGGCHAVVLDPAGDVAVQQRDLLLIATGLMLLIIVPVMALTVVFAWRYRKSNGAARYEPDWDHSTQLELVIWAAPLLIIVFLGAITWMGTHLLDPYRPLGRIARGEAVAADARPVRVQVVALDWKWLFIYPDYGVATVNELAVPVNRPLAFSITSSSVMNSFSAPALAGQIYAMPGMETKLHAVANRPGDFEGLSANYSGAGFSGMRFRLHALPQAGFADWVRRVKAGGGALDRPGYLMLERPSENAPVRRYASVDPTLFAAALNMCVEPGKMCMNEMMSLDARGGLPIPSAHDILPVADHGVSRRGAVMGAPPGFMASICRPREADAGKLAEVVSARSSSPLTGAGLTPPKMTPVHVLASAGRSSPRTAILAGF
jgi:cytochrome o ubiquinol oxidase subunit 2